MKIGDRRIFVVRVIRTAGIKGDPGPGLHPDKLRVSTKRNRVCTGKRGNRRGGRVLVGQL